MSAEPIGSVLVVDDDAAVGTVLVGLLSQGGISARHVPSVDEALRAFASGSFEVVITDLRMPGRDGMELLRALRQMSPDLGVIVLTAHGTIPIAVEAMKAGASDFLTKPFERDEVLFTVRKALTAVAHGADAPPRLRDDKSSLFGGSPQMLALAERVKRASTAVANVLVRGESGTGKELIARAIHDLGPRSASAFVAVNCAALPDDLLESELFGYERGAFTGAVARKPGRVELAEGGTLFLDEIGDVSAALQPKLLRLLQTKEYQPLGGTRTEHADVRFVAATHRDLESMVTDGRFREDLYYRLNVIPIWLPPLRDRRDDIPELAQRFCENLARENGRGRMRLSDAALRRLGEYEWTGNVRELQNVVERLVVFTDGELIEPADIAREMQRPKSPSRATAAPPADGAASDAPALERVDPSSLAARRTEAEREAVLDALRRSADNRSKAARLLGISRRTLYKRLAEFGLS